MPNKTPFHPCTEAACHSYAWKEWAGYLAVCSYDRHSEEEYFAFRHSAGLIDVTPLYKYDVRGPDAAALLARVWTRDVRKMRVGRVMYSAMADPWGKCLDDGTIQRLDEDLYRVTSSEPWLRWMRRNGRGLDATVTDVSNQIAAVALQGPRARQILQPITDFDLDKMRFFRVRRTTVGGRDAWISRTGYTGDLGFEIWVENGDAVPLWQALVEEGRPHGLTPCGLDALDVVRIEAGFVLQGVDYISANSCLVESQKSTPYEAGLGWTVELDRAPFSGSRALRGAAEVGWRLIGVVLDWPALEKLHDRLQVPPHLAPVACRQGVPVYDRPGGTQIGQITSTTWSPLLKKYLGIGQVRRPHGGPGTTVHVEHTVEYERHTVPAVVTEMPFFDPPRKTAVPANAKRQREEPRDEQP